MRELIQLTLSTFCAGLWLWAWQRYVPRPPDRTIEEQFEHRPPGSLVFLSFVLFLTTPLLFVLPMQTPKPEGELTAEQTIQRKEENLKISFIATLASAPIIVAGVLAAAKAQFVPWWTFGIQRGGLKSAAIEGFRVCWEWLPLVVCVNALARTALNKAPEQVNPVEEILLGKYGVDIQVLAAAAAVLRAPIIEELVFRGMFQTWFNIFTAWPGMLCASILFAAVHSSAWPDPLPLVLVGIMLGLAYQRTRNLLAPMIAHAIFNGVMTVFALVKGIWS
jgi:membrane protease YdiL (CAAX protease family)